MTTNLLNDIQKPLDETLCIVTGEPFPLYTESSQSAQRHNDPIQTQRIAQAVHKNRQTRQKALREQYAVQMAYERTTGIVEAKTGIPAVDAEVNGESVTWADAGWWFCWAMLMGGVCMVGGMVWEIWKG